MTELQDDNVMYEHNEDEGLFEELSHKWQNFIERLSEMLGFDADRYEKP